MTGDECHSVTYHAAHATHQFATPERDSVLVSIAFYIQHSGATWGILTNGRLWRLYHRDSAYKQDRFYEVDLPPLVEETE